MSAPQVSVVIPVLNAGDTLGEQLQALAEQDYAGIWEVVVADNGSTDGTGDVVEHWQRSMPFLRRVEAGPRGLARARWRGCEQAHGDLIAICDGDDVVTPGWLSALVLALEDHDLAGGPLEWARLNGGRATYWGSPHAGPPSALSYLPYASGSNIAFHRRVVESLGGWDATFPGGAEDIDFSWRAQQEGFTLGWAPNALIHARQRQDHRSLRRQFYRYGRSEALLYRRHRHAGARAEGLRFVLGRWHELLHQALRYGSLDAERRQRWHRQLAYRWGRLAGSLRQGVLYL